MNRINQHKSVPLRHIPRDERGSGIVKTLAEWHCALDQIMLSLFRLISSYRPMPATAFYEISGTTHRCNYSHQINTCFISKPFITFPLITGILSRSRLYFLALRPYTNSKSLFSSHVRFHSTERPKRRSASHEA